MKRNPTLAEKKQLRRLGIDSADWLIRKHTQTEMLIEHKHTGKRRSIPTTLIKR